MEIPPIDAESMAFYASSDEYGIHGVRFTGRSFNDFLQKTAKRRGVSDLRTRT